VYERLIVDFISRDAVFLGLVGDDARVSVEVVGHGSERDL